ncbi:MAG: 30S ribosomal protein S3 [Candidatus Pacebacteria bacterium]|nr:30S ribosomal protein S3 [Candidatus Paceibacterota bacterium]
MAHKVHPKIIRIGITEEWESVWFSSLKKYKKIIQEDLKIRDFLKKKLGKGIIEKVKIERTGNKINIIIKTPKPGVVIGRGGEGVEMLSKTVAKMIKEKEIKIDIEEVKDPSLSASIIAQQIAMDIERRVPYRRAAKRAIERIFQRREVEGLKIKIKGRLNGADIARSETFKEGKLPLQTLRSDIDYSEQRARCSYGTVSVKVWLYKGEKI